MSNRVAPFVGKAFAMMSEESPEMGCGFSVDGSRFRIFHMEAFTSTALPKVLSSLPAGGLAHTFVALTGPFLSCLQYFRHRNYRSFTRQLNQ